MAEYIKFVQLLLVALCVYIKILNITNLSKSKIAYGILFSLVMSIPLSYVPPMYELIFLGSFCIFAGFATKIKLPLLLTAVFISTGISLGIEILGFTIMIFLAFVFDIVLLAAQSIFGVQAPEQFMISPIAAQIVVFIISGIITYFYLRLKRLKRGFVFLESKEAVWIGIIFSVMTMIGRTFIEDTFVIFIVVNLCTIGIHLWWQHHTTMLYHQRLKQRDIERCNAEIKEQNKQIKALDESNEFLSKAIHRDNKLIPAMYHAVSSLLSSSDTNIDNELKTKGMNILNELDGIMKERKEMLKQVQRECKLLPTTEMERVDYILNYMYQRAYENKIQFDLIVSVSVKNIAESVIERQKLETLLADLIENAITAVNYSERKKILVTMAIIDNCYEINIQDSGIQFEVETLVNLGIKKTTTHADDNGSGIGYITIFEILKESGASLIISDYTPENHSFTKSVIVRFDNKSEYIIYSYRAKNISQATERNDMIIHDAISD